jgi:hypothetical protein
MNMNIGPISSIAQTLTNHLGKPSLPGVLGAASKTEAPSKPNDVKPANEAFQSFLAQLDSASQAQPNALDETAKTDTTETPSDSKQTDKTREAFDSFVGQSFYGQMLKSMRSSVGKSDYFHGGQAEETFQQQLDQVLTEEMTAASANTFTGPMYDLFTLNRGQ